MTLLVNGALSSVLYLSCGVFKGFILGPLLFLCCTVSAKKALGSRIIGGFLYLLQSHYTVETLQNYVPTSG